MQTTEKNFFLFSAKQNHSGERSPVPGFHTSGGTAAVQSRPKAARSGGAFVVTQPAAAPCTEGSPMGPLLTPTNRSHGTSPSRKAISWGRLPCSDRERRRLLHYRERAKPPVSLVSFLCPAFTYAKPGLYFNSCVTIFKGSFWLKGSDHTAHPTGGSPRRN